jgi:molecular chaperone DnaK
VGVVGIIGRYSFRAVQRMNEEQEDYDAWKARFGPCEGEGADGNSSPVSIKVLGVDLGTSSLRCAISEANNNNAPELVEDREGGRSTPSYVFYESADADAEAVTGRMAHQRLYSGPYDVVSPWKLISSSPEPDEASTKITAMMLRDVIVNAVDKKAAGSIGAVEGVLSYNPSFTKPQQAALVKAATIAGLIDPYIVCEPVGAAIAGEFNKLLTPEEKAKPVMVVDIGHAVASFSVVHNDKLVATSSANAAGELLQDLLVKHLAEKFMESDKVDLLQDKMSVQKLYDAAAMAVVELSKKSRVDVDLPYITADASGPKHLQVPVSRQVLEQILNENVQDLLVSKDFGSDVGALVVGNFMQALTDAKLTPMQLGAVLLVGGASRSPIYKDAVQKALGMLGGGDWATRTLKVADGVMAEELTVQGVALSLR